jgi:hypothetical protein
VRRSGLFIMAEVYQPLQFIIADDYQRTTPRCSLAGLRTASARYLPCCFRQAMKASRFASSVGGYRPSVR